MRAAIYWISTREYDLCTASDVEWYSTSFIFPLIELLEKMPLAVLRRHAMGFLFHSGGTNQICAMISSTTICCWNFNGPQSTGFVVFIAKHMDGRTWRLNGWSVIGISMHMALNAVKTWAATFLSFFWNFYSWLARAMLTSIHNWTAFSLCFNTGTCRTSIRLHDSSQAASMPSTASSKLAVKLSVCTNVGRM